MKDQHNNKTDQVTISRDEHEAICIRLVEAAVNRSEQRLNTKLNLIEEKDNTPMRYVDIFLLVTVGALVGHVLCS